MKRALAAVLGASLLLAGCGQSSPPAATSPANPYADGIDHSWTASTAEGQRIYGALSQGLKSQDFNVGLSITATNGWGPIELNTSNGESAAGDGHPITLNGQAYSTGLGVHADSEIHIHATNLETPACTRFKADVGVDDEVGDKGSVVFQVFADGVKLFDSGVMTGASATQHINVGIGNKSDLRFVVTNGGDNYYYDHADWAGAAITCEPPASKPSVTLDKSDLSIYHLHSNTLQASFSGFPAGPVQLRLVADPIVVPGSVSTAAPALVLDTTSVTLTGSQTQTRTLSISAPKSVSFFGGGQIDNDTFRLISSVNGVDQSSVPVKLTELQLKLNSYFEPASISGPTGTIANLILVTKIDPPLSGPVQITAGTLETQHVEAVASGTTTGTGGEMKTPVQMKITAGAGLGSTSSDLININIQGVASGYRDPWYGEGSTTHLDVTRTAGK